jgi:hypothetical protein
MGYRVCIDIKDPTEFWWNELFNSLHRPMDREVIRWFVDRGNDEAQVGEYLSAHPYDNENVIKRKFTDMLKIGLLSNKYVGRYCYYRLNPLYYNRLTKTFEIEHSPNMPM